MPIVVDYSNVSIAAIMAIVHDSKISIDSDICKHAILNSLRKTNVKFRQEFGQMIIVCDDSNDRGWRYKEFPHYKFKRKNRRRTDDIDWDMVNAAKDYVSTGIIDAFPWPVIAVSSCEADDVIGWYALNTDQKTVIVGNDKDYHQCHSQLVCQWKPGKKILVSYPDPARQLKEMLLRGDTDDGVPNFRSPDNVFTIPGARQKPMHTVKVNEWLDMPEKEFLFLEEIPEKKVKGVIKPAEIIDRKANYERNRKLIDFRFIPDELKPEIMDRMTNYSVNRNKKKTIKWLSQHQMSYLLERFENFF